MKTLGALAATLFLFGCTGQGTDSSSTSSLSSTQLAAATAAATAVHVPDATGPRRCGPVVEPDATTTPPNAVNGCAADEQCCNGFCVGDNVLCIAPPPPPRTCGISATADPASTAAVCPADEHCCNGFCVGDNVLCVAPPPECQTAADCKGPLPDLCEVCADGKTECAHHACIAGKCVTEVCEPSSTGGPTPSSN